MDTALSIDIPMSNISLKEDTKETVETQETVKSSKLRMLKKHSLPRIFKFRKNNSKNVTEYHQEDAGGDTVKNNERPNTASEGGSSLDQKMRYRLMQTKSNYQTKSVDNKKENKNSTGLSKYISDSWNSMFKNSKKNLTESDEVLARNCPVCGPNSSTNSQLQKTPRAENQDAEQERDFEETQT